MCGMATAVTAAAVTAAAAATGTTPRTRWRPMAEPTIATRTHPLRGMLRDLSTALRCARPAVLLTTIAT
jgi:hypothetical protein